MCREAKAIKVTAGVTGTKGDKGDPGSTSAGIRIALTGAMKDITSSEIPEYVIIPQVLLKLHLFKLLKQAVTTGTYITATFRNARNDSLWWHHGDANSENGHNCSLHLEKAPAGTLSWEVLPNSYLMIEAPSKTPVYYSSSCLACLITLSPI